jgi:hypothetical protein
MPQENLMLRPAVPFALCLILAACNGDGTTISIDGNDDDNSSVTTDANGQIEIHAPGLSGSLKLPKMTMRAEDFEVNGVKLYPGSTMKTFHVDSRGDKDGKVTLSFESPAAPDTVRDWFRDNMTKQGFKVATSGDNLSGTTDDGQPFAVTLDGDGGGKTRGKMQVGN